MSTVVSPDAQAVYVAVEAFLAFILPNGTPTVRGLQNRVPTPAGEYVLMQAMLHKRLATNITVYTDDDPDAGTRAIQQNTQVEVQLDFYGAQAHDWAIMAETLWRDEQGCALLGPTCQPLHADNAIQIPHVTAEDEFQERWTLRAFLQYNPVTTLPQQFADALQVDIINVDERYPP